MKIKDFFLVLIFIIGIEYLLNKSALPITFGDLFFICCSLLMYGLIFLFLREYFFEKPSLRNRMFMQIDEPLWKLFLYLLFFLLMLAVGIYMFYQGLIDPFKGFDYRGTQLHGYAEALFGSSFSLITLLFNLAIIKSIFRKFMKY